MTNILIAHRFRERVVQIQTLNILFDATDDLLSNIRCCDGTKAITLSLDRMEEQNIVLPLLIAINRFADIFNLLQDYDDKK